MAHQDLSRTEDQTVAGMFQGHLGESELADVLQFLALSKKTGELLIDIAGELPARIYFKHGDLVHATCGTREGLDVLWALSSHHQGEFIFQPNVLSPLTSIDTPLQHILLEIAHHHDESANRNGVSAGADTGREPMKSLKELLNELIHVDGINTAVLVGRDGFVIEGLVSSGRLDAEAIGAVISTGIGSSEVMGRELQVGQLEQTMVEYDGGIVVVNLVGDNAILAVVADLKTPLGNVRYQVKKRLPQIIEALA
ncbi:MAG: DUF4388 domain-containing protein [Deltaproteobacteria bacterium]|nr:MAG: DUF4388 domain-containing protein [Deltaproteobacteria bacterium]